MEETGFRTRLAEVEVDDGFEASMVVLPPCSGVRDDDEIVATCVCFANSLVIPDRLSACAGELFFSVSSLDSFLDFDWLRVA